MNPKSALIALIATALALGAGYWLGARGTNPHEAHAPAAHSGEDGGRRILYYRNPMGQPDTSPVPKKDSMGMDYIPVYADEADDAGLVKVSPGRMQTLGVRTEAVQREVLDARIAAAGRIEADESRRQIVTAKFDGYIERLFVDTTGQAVQRGQPLFAAYSPELVSAQREYLIAQRGLEALREADSSAREGMRALSAASLARLRNWDISSAQLRALEQGGEAQRSLSLLAPISGVVTEKTAVQGQRFAAGEPLYTITDLSRVWLIAQLFEPDLGQVQVGESAQVRIDAFPNEAFEGTVAQLYPELDPATRSVPVRIELDNPDGRLRPGMFARAELAGAATEPVLVAPASALIDNGEEQLVLVEQGEGRFAPRAVETGRRTGQRVEIRQGLAAGERVVTSANFLIDADARMQAAIAGFATAGDGHDHAAAHAQHEGIDPALPRHGAEGRVESIDHAGHSIMLFHGPVASLGWPSMTMPFSYQDPALVEKLKPGQAIHFEFVEPGPGQWIITAIHPMGEAALEHEADGHSGMDHDSMDHGSMDHGTMDHGDGDDRAGHH